MPARTLYASQSCTIKTNGGTTYDELAVESASLENTIPYEDVFILGKLGSVDRRQKEFATCTADVKIIHNNGGTDMGTVISSLTGEAIGGSPATISVAPSGFTMRGILSSATITASVGEFLSTDLSFAGVGTGTLFNGSGVTTVGGAGTQPAKLSSVTPYDSSSITLSAGSGVNSATVTFDFPTETVTNLGSAITGTQEEIEAGNVVVGKPPFSCSIALEGTAVDNVTPVSSITMGDVTVTLTDGKVTSSSFSQAVGDIGATYSATTEGTSFSIS